MQATVGWSCFDQFVVDVVLGALLLGDRVILGHRSPTKRRHPDVWDLPGGVVEPGESELDALARELREELGVEVARGSVTHLCRVTAGAPGDPWVVSAWLVREWRGTPANCAPEEHTAIGWFGLEELPPLAHHRVRESLAEALRTSRG